MSFQNSAGLPSFQVNDDECRSPIAAKVSEKQVPVKRVYGEIIVKRARPVGRIGYWDDAMQFVCARIPSDHSRDVAAIVQHPYDAITVRAQAKNRVKPQAMGSRSSSPSLIRERYGPAVLQQFDDAVIRRIELVQGEDYAAAGGNRNVARPLRKRCNYLQPSGRSRLLGGAC
jgi:hypothetical protein